LFRAILKTAISSLGLLFFISFFLFLLIYFLPGNVTDAMFLRSEALSVAIKEQILENLGLKDGFFVQYFRWLAHFVMGDFGTSFVSGASVFLLIKDFMHSKFYFLRSLVLTLFALFAFSGMAQKNVYDFKVKDENGRMVSLSKYRGKVLLIVNTATQCGLTPQYKPLQELYDKYRDKGLVILGFPCNQFKGQAPGTNKEIRQFCEANYGVTFPQFAKIDVNGKNAIPLYRYLKRQQPFFGYLMSDSTQRAEFERLPKDVPFNVMYDIQWNFTKFIVDREGKVVKRIEPKDTMPYLEEEVAKVIGQGR